MNMPLVRSAAALSLFGFLTLGLAFSLLAAEKEAKGDLKKFQGSWVSESGPESKWVFEDDNLKADVNQHHYTCRVKLDETARPFPTLDLKINGGDAEGLGKTSKAIYKFEGPLLILCIGMPGVDERPTKFETVEEKFYLFELSKTK